jgi:hypothetical protein
MSERLVRLDKANKRHERDQSRPKLSTEERGALNKMRTEAKAKGVKLHHNGVGGLPPSVALRIFRRDEYTCKKCGKNQSPLGLHHKGGIPDSQWLRRKGHQTVQNNLAAICDKCHDDLHQDAREEGTGQKPKDGDEEKDEEQEPEQKSDKALPVGRHADLPDSDFDAAELNKGIAHEMEHTDDAAIARAIAIDHLVEMDDYYTRLEQMERKHGKKRR